MATPPELTPHQCAAMIDGKVTMDEVTSRDGLIDISIPYTLDSRVYCSKHATDVLRTWAGKHISKMIDDARVPYAGVAELQSRLMSDYNKNMRGGLPPIALSSTSSGFDMKQWSTFLALPTIAALASMENHRVMCVNYDMEGRPLGTEELLN